MHQNFECHFLGQSLLLSTTVLNDISVGTYMQLCMNVCVHTYLCTYVTMIYEFDDLMFFYLICSSLLS